MVWFQHGSRRECLLKMTKGTFFSITVSVIALAIVYFPDSVSNRGRFHVISVGRLRYVPFLRLCIRDEFAAHLEWNQPSNRFFAFAQRALGEAGCVAIMGVNYVSFHLDDLSFPLEPLWKTPIPFKCVWYACKVDR